MELYRSEKEAGFAKDNVLSFELSRNSEISEVEIARVLSYFPDSDRYEENICQISDAIISVLSTDAASAIHLKGALDPISKTLLETRQLSATYMGHMTPQPIIPAIWGNMLSAYINANTIAVEASQAESVLEPEAIGHLIRMVGYKEGVASGVFTTGGTEANHTALTLARLLVEKEALEKKVRIDESTVLASPYAHYSLKKSIRQLGGINSDIKLLTVKPDDFRMSVSDLEEQLKDLRKNRKSIMAIFAIAGETETGKVDDLQSISWLSQKYEVPFIVDGAFGAPYKTSKVGYRFKGLEDAFAITLDPHKTLYEPYSSGALLVKRAENHALIGDIQLATYAGFTEGYQNVLEGIKNNNIGLGQKRLSGSIGAQAILATLASIRTLGLEGYQTIYNLTIDRVRHLHERLSKSNVLYPLHEPDINLLCFGLRKEVQAGLGLKEGDSLKKYINSTRENLDNGIKGKGGYHFSTTELPLNDGSILSVFRACIMNPRTTDVIIDDAVGQLESNIKNDLSKAIRFSVS